MSSDLGEADSAPPAYRHIMILGVAVLVAIVLGGLALFVFLRSPAPANPAVAASTSTNAAAPVPVAPANPPAASPAAPAALVDSQAFGDWTFGCATEGKDCAIEQSRSATAPASGTAVWRIAKDAAGALTAIWTTPTGVMVSRGMKLDLGSGPPTAIRFDSCEAQSCEVRAKLTPNFLALITRAPRLAIGVMRKDGQSVAVEFSPAGLADALGKLAPPPAATAPAAAN